MKEPNWTEIDQPQENIIAFADIEKPIRAILLQGERTGRIYRREFESGRYEVAELRPHFLVRTWRSMIR